MKTNQFRPEITTELIVGAFVFLVLLVIGYFTIVLSRENLFRKKYELEVEFRNVMGLRSGDNVVVRGMTVGKVKDTHLEGGRVSVVCSLDVPVRLKKDYRVSILQTSILGGRMLEIHEGSDDAERLPRGLKVIGTEPYDLMVEAAMTIHDIRRSLSEGKVLENLEKTLAEIRSVAERLNRGEGTVGKLLTDETAYRDLEKMLSEGRDAVGMLKDTVGRLNAGEGTLGKLMTDDSLYTNIAAVAENLRAVSQRIADGKGTLGRLLSEDDALYRDLSQAAASLKDVSARLEKGEGTLGKLLRDESLYNDVKGAIEETRAAIDDFRETAPIVSFTSILFGAF